MKKTYLLPLVALLSAAFGFIASGAEPTAISVEKYDFTIQVPRDWIFITSEMSPTEPVFEQLGVEGESFLEMMKQTRLLIDAVSTDIELALTNTDESDVVHLTGLSDKELSDFMDEMKRQDMNAVLEDAKSEVDTLATVTDMAFEPIDIYRNGSMTYIISDTRVSYDEAVVYGHQYYTIVNKNIFTFQFNSLTGQAFTEAQKATAREIMNTLEFRHLDELKQNSGSAYDWHRIWREGLKGAVGGGIIGMAAAGIWLLYRKKFQKSK